MVDEVDSKRVLNPRDWQGMVAVKWTRTREGGENKVLVYAV